MLRICILFFVLTFFPPKDYERLDWKENQKITWEDFKGKPDKLSSYAASVNSGISHNYALNSRGFLIKEESVVKAFFYPTLSWYKPDMVDRRILQHERLHFDISELHARKLRKRIAEYKFTENSQREIKKLYNQVEQEREEMQKAFDKESEHSQYRQAELFWESKISELLYEYDDWK
ncbi:MAG: DUF922 domain-containing protein [Leeuwenhoekiella sp.]